MRLRALTLACIVFLAAPAAAVAAPPFKATLTAPTHTPKINVKWYYTVRVTDLKGKPIRAKITVLVVDPSGAAHPVQYDNTTKNLVNWPIVGVFRDYAEWPPDSRGFPLTFRVIVRAASAVRKLDYVVRVR